jgi:hypothetical protein
MSGAVGHSIVPSNQSSSAAQKFSDFVQNSSEFEQIVGPTQAPQPSSMMPTQQHDFVPHPITRIYIPIYLSMWRACQPYSRMSMATSTLETHIRVRGGFVNWINAWNWLIMGFRNRVDMQTQSNLKSLT